MTPVLVTLIQNAALLLAMVVVFDLVTSQKQVYGQWRRQALAGLILGGLCIGLMLASFRLETGIIFDTRSVLLSVSGLFLGPIPTFFAMAIAVIYRLLLGGTGVWPGILVILATGGVGILWRYYSLGRLENISIRELYGFGVLVHLVMLTMMLTLPWETARRVLAGIGLPVLLVYPIATIALGWLLTNRFRRENASAAVAESEARYRSLFEAANVGKSVTLPTGEINVNRAFCDMLGYAPEELRGKNWQELTPPEEIGPINELLVPLLRGEKDAVRFEKRYIHKNGSYVWADVSATLQRDRDGNPLHFIATIVDITERKRAEEELANEATRRRVLMGQSRDGIVILDQNGQVFESNKKFADMLGYPLDSMCRLNVIDWEYLYPPERVIEMIRSVDEKGDHFETRHRRRDGTIYDVEISTNAAWFSGQKLIFCVCRDITDRKRTEEKMAEQLQELKRWQAVMLDREGRVLELKKEVNELLKQAGKEEKYRIIE